MIYSDIPPPAGIHFVTGLCHYNWCFGTCPWTGDILSTRLIPRSGMAVLDALMDMTGLLFKGFISTHIADKNRYLSFKKNFVHLMGVKLYFSVILICISLITSMEHHLIIPSQFSLVQSLSRVRLFATPWIAARQASLSITISRSSSRLTSIELGMPSRHLILCHPLLLLPPVPPSWGHVNWPVWFYSSSVEGKLPGTVTLSHLFSPVSLILQLPQWLTPSGYLASIR